MPTAAPEIIGRYQVLKAIGEGGMGALYLARDPAIDRLVAIKLLREGFDSPELRQRFASEARSAGRLHHQNIVTIFDVGDHDRQPFIAMEYIKGETLAELGRRQAIVSLARKLDWMDKLCAGLYYAHRAGVIHRDIKPANIMIDEEGILKILDFGIARFGASEMTQAGMVIGTLNYMAPEQMMGRPIDARADIFSVGAVFYEILTYQRAFPGDLSTGIVHKILSGHPDPLETILPDLDSAVIAVVSRCLEKDPDKRYPDLGVTRRELAGVRNRIATEDLSDWGPTVSMPLPVDTPAPSHTPSPPRRRSDTSRQQLLQLRAKQIEGHFKEASAALERGDFSACRDACQQALLLDPENRPVLELEERAQAAIEEQHLRGWLKEARGELERGALTAASLLVDRALSLSESSPDALKVREAIDEARRELAEAQERARQLDAAIATARQSLDTGALDTAAAAVSEALALEPTNAAALALKDRVAAAIVAKRKAEEDRRARTVVDAARRTFALGKIEAALQMLSSFTPAHTLVTETLGELQIEAKEIERRREIDRAKREIAQRLDEASARAREQDFAGALARVNDILAREPQHAEALALRTRVEDALDRQRQVAAHLAAAKKLIDDRKFQDALGVVGQAAALDANAAGLADLRRAAEAGLEAEAAARVRREIDGHLTAATKALEAKDYPHALDRVQSALRIEPGHAAANALKEKVGRAIAASEAVKNATAPAISQDQTIVLKPEARIDPRQATTIRIPAPAETRPAATAPPVVAPAQAVTPHLPAAPPEPTIRLSQPIASQPDVTIAIQPPVEHPSRPPVAPPVTASPALPNERTIVIPAKGVDPAPIDLELRRGPARKPAAATSAKTIPSGMVMAVAAAVVLAVVVGLALKFRSGGAPASPPVAPATVVLNITPWAKIDAVVNKKDSKPVSIGDAVTPVVLTLAPGDYHVRASNPGFSGTLEFDVTVAGNGPGGGVQEVRQTMPGFRPEDEIDHILNQ